MLDALEHAQDRWDHMADDPPEDPEHARLAAQNAQLLELIKSYQVIGTEAADKLDRSSPEGGQGVRLALVELQEELACVTH